MECKAKSILEIEEHIFGKPTGCQQIPGVNFTNQEISAEDTCSFVREVLPPLFRDPRCQSPRQISPSELMHSPRPSGFDTDYSKTSSAKREHIPQSSGTTRNLKVYTDATRI